MCLRKIGGKRATTKCDRAYELHAELTQTVGTILCWQKRFTEYCVFTHTPDCFCLLRDFQVYRLGWEQVKGALERGVSHTILQMVYSIKLCMRCMRIMFRLEIEWRGVGHAILVFEGRELFAVDMIYTYIYYIYRGDAVNDMRLR